MKLHRVSAVLGVAGAITLAAAGCADPNRAWVTNETDTVMRVRFWCGPRESGYDPSTLTPGEVFDVNPGSHITVMLDESVGFESAGSSIVRLQAQPLGVGFKRIIHYWFEINAPGPYGVKAIGVRPDIRAERDGTGTMNAVPMEYWPTEQPSNER